MSKSKSNQSYIIPDGLKQKEKIDVGLKLLKLEGMRFSFDALARDYIKQQKTSYDFLESLTEIECSWKHDNRVEYLIKNARFPFIRSIYDFDFDFQPNINKQQIMELASCRFIERGENIIFLGKSGVGKTHLIISLGMEAIDKLYSVRYLHIGDLIESINRTTNNGDDLYKLLKNLLRFRLLILDEMNPYNVSPESSKFLFKLLWERHEQRRSTIFASNHDLKEWVVLFGSKNRAEAVMDRILTRQMYEIITIEGPSHRAERGENSLKLL
ncbi:ATP-binding protein [Candidatus Microgenomates bacterium]|nr:ATP-binding protein [Candidatus Microgenomates bacterium]